MAIKIGENDVKTLKVGDKQVKKLYQGTQLVWEDFKGFTFEGEKGVIYHRIKTEMPLEDDPALFKNVWAIVDGIDRLIWTASGVNVLTINTGRNRLDLKDDRGKYIAYTFLDTGEELPAGEYTFKVELI